MSERKHQCAYCGSDKQKVCFQCCDTTTEEINAKISALEKKVDEIAGVLEERISNIHAILRRQ